MALRSLALRSLSALLAMTSVAAAQPTAKTFPNTADGLPLTQLGLNGIAYWVYEDQFLNLLKQSDYAFAASRNWPDGTTQSFEDMYAAGLIDKETMVPTAIPESFSMVRTGLFRGGARYWPEYYAGTYVFDWEGDAAARCGFSAPTRKVGTNRIECDYPATDTNWSNIELTRIGSGFKNPRLFRKENEALINAGVVFDPKWLSLIARYKIIRTMDIQNANNSWMRSVDESAKKSFLAWGANDSYSATAAALGIKRGIPLEALFDMAVASDTALWLNVPGILGAPQVFIDEVGALSAWQTGQTWIRARAKENAQEIIASPEWRNYADEIARSMKAANYPASKTLYVELWNEVWNTAHPWWKMTFYNSGLAEGIGGVEGLPYRYGYGYMTAMFAVHLDAALKAAGRADQSWVMVLAGQNANPETTRSALLGFKRYFKEKGIDPAPYLARLGVSTASYFYDAMAMDLKTGLFPAESDAARDAQWLAAIKADPEGLARRLTDRIAAAPASTFGGIAWAAQMRAAHEKLSLDAGAFFLGDYEGHDHFMPPGSLGANPIFVNWFEDWRSGPEGERLTKAWADALLAQNPNAVLSNYHSIGARDPEGASKSDNQLASPWIDAAPGEENGRTRGLEHFLRPKP